MFSSKAPSYTLTKKRHGVCKGKYILSMNDYYTYGYTKLREHFDPYDNRRIGDNNIWKFNTKEEAEELIILARLKGLM
jgi:hypothetical protein